MESKEHLYFMLLESTLRCLEKMATKRTEEKTELKPLDVMTLLRLPNRLRKTAMAMLKCTKNRVTANEVAEITGRARRVESRYLNQLVAMGHLKKKRKGRTTYFYIENVFETPRNPS